MNLRTASIQASSFLLFRDIAADVPDNRIKITDDLGKVFKHHFSPFQDFSGNSSIGLKLMFFSIAAQLVVSTISFSQAVALVVSYLVHFRFRLGSRPQASFRLFYGRFGCRAFIGFVIVLSLGTRLWHCPFLCWAPGRLHQHPLIVRKGTHRTGPCSRSSRLSARLIS